VIRPTNTRTNFLDNEVTSYNKIHPGKRPQPDHARVGRRSDTIGGNRLDRLPG
jgi:hypothetical protein